MGLHCLVSAGTGEMKKRYGMIYVDKTTKGRERWNGYVKRRFTGIGSHRQQWRKYLRLEEDITEIQAL